MNIVDCRLTQNGDVAKGYVVLSDEREFDILWDRHGLHVRRPYADRDVSNPRLYQVIREHLTGI